MPNPKEQEMVTVYTQYGQRFANACSNNLHTDHVFMEFALFTGTMSCWNMFGLLSYSEVKRNHTETFGTTLGQPFGEELHIGVMARCPQTFGH